MTTTLEYRGFAISVVTSTSKSGDSRAVTFINGVEEYPTCASEAAAIDTGKQLVDLHLRGVAGVGPWSK